MTASTSDQRTLWPGYVYPSIWDPGTAWLQFGQYAQRGVDGSGSVAVMNPASGPGAAVNPDWTGAVNAVRSAGHRVVGYTHTSYGSRPAAEVKPEVDAYYGWYGVDGVFVDEMSTDEATKAYYRDLFTYVDRKPGDRLVVGNPGTSAATDWQVRGNQRVADILVVFEGDQAAYNAWSPPAWVGSYAAANFAHLVYAAGDLASAVARSRTMNAAWRYITSDGPPNPWDSLTYWPAQATP